MNTNLIDIVQDLLGRPLVQSDGLPCDTVAAAESSLGIQLPLPLSELYRLVGHLPLFMEGFQRISKPGELWMQNSKLVFMEENQGVCHWAVATDNHSLPVYQCADPDTAEWYEEEIDLDAFLRLTLYYQYLQANSHRHHVLSLKHLQDDRQKQQWVEEHCSGKTKVVDHNGLVIYNHPQKLVWYYCTEDGAPSEEIYELSKQVL